MPSAKARVSPSPPHLNDKHPKNPSVPPPSFPSFDPDGSEPFDINAGLSPDDPGYIGPKMRVFSEAMPPQWRQILTGFMGEGYVDSYSPPPGPREEYVRMWLTCEESLYTDRLGVVIMKVEDILEGLEKRETRYVRAGAARKRVDDMLEYGIRLATGARVLQDKDAAFRTLFRVARGPYPKDKIATANNLLCYMYKKYFVVEPTLEHLICLMAFGDMAAAACSSLSHCGFMLANFFAPLKEVEPYKSFKSLWNKYEEYRKENGLVPPGQKACFICGKIPERRRYLKRCAGSCLIPRKPVYCGTKCQKKHWPTHKKWCSKDFKLTESDVESDQYYTDYDDWDSEDDYDSEDDSEDEEWEDDDDDGTSDEGDYDEPSSKRSRMEGEDTSEDGEEEWYSASTESDEDDNANRSETKSKYSHPENCGCRAEKAGQSVKRKVWNDEGDDDFDRFVLDIARVVIRLWNT